MRLPCEVYGRKVIPATRTIIVEELSDRHNLNQTEIAEKLGISQPAVSQYLRSARGDCDLVEAFRGSELYPELQELADELVDGSSQREEIIGMYCNFCISNFREILGMLGDGSDEDLVDEVWVSYLESRKK